MSFLDGRPDRSQYRHFKVHAPSFPDDYAMMYEILKRRYSRLNGEDAPDLLVVDGGKGQLNVALGVLSELGLRDLSAVGIAKDKGPTLKRITDKTADKIYLPNVKDPLLFGHSASLQYLQRIRDEAHRFAVSYHKKIRGKQGLQTILDEIPGIGAVKRKALLREFGSMGKIREASADTLGRVAPLNCTDAVRVYEFFHAGTIDKHQLPSTNSQTNPNPQIPNEPAG